MEDNGDALDSLVELSRAYGSDPELVLGGGGNTSVKLGDRLLVKASGSSLAEIGPESFVELQRAALQELLDTDLAESRAEREAAFKEALLGARLDPASGLRPSVESVLHHLMPGRFVVHLHATAVNQFACSRGGRTLVEEHLAGEVAWVDLVDPGFILARTMREVLGTFRDTTGKERPRAVILANHGVVVSGETAEETRAQLDWLLGRLRTVRAQVRRADPGPAAAGPSPGPAAVATLSTTLADLLAGAGAPSHVFDQSDAVVGFVNRADGREVALGGPVTPDEIVYCLSFPLWVEAGADADADEVELAQRLETDVRAYETRYGGPPKIVLVQGTGMFAFGPSAAEAETARLVYSDAIKIMSGALDLGGVKYLDDDFREFIEHWELESYRRKRLFGR